MSDNNLASELVENRSIFNPFTIEEIFVSSSYDYYSYGLILSSQSK